jgi:hypothetical protein
MLRKNYTFKVFKNLEGVVNLTGFKNLSGFNWI